MNITPSSLGTIAGTAPYLRLADQHTWGSNFLEVGGVAMWIPLQQIPGILNPSSQNSYLDWGFEATYQRTFGSDTLAITANILFEQQDLVACFAAGTSANASNSLDQFRLAASYYWTTRMESPWHIVRLNVRIGLQYTHYLQFNGGTTNYDRFARNASDNDTLLLFTWCGF
jgi:hypothetical protein